MEQVVYTKHGLSPLKGQGRYFDLYKRIARNRAQLEKQKGGLI